MFQRGTVSSIGFPADFVSVLFVTQRSGPKSEDTIDPRPSTSFPIPARLRVCDFTDSARPPIRPPTHPFYRLPQRLPPKRSIAHDLAGLVASCHRIVSQDSVLRCWHKRHCAVRFSLRVCF